MNPIIIGVAIIIIIIIIIVVVVVTQQQSATSTPATSTPAASTTSTPAASTKPTAAVILTPAVLTPKTLSVIPGTAIKCSGYNPAGDGAIYRYDGGSAMRHYPNPDIAGSWDPNWGSAAFQDCTGLQFNGVVERNPNAAAPAAAAAPAVNTSNYRPIKADAGGRCLDVPNGSRDNEVALQMYDCNGSDAQKWTYDAGSKAFKNAFGKCMDVSHGDRNGAVQQYDCNGTAAQQWTTDGSHRIISGIDNSLCLNISGGAGNNGDKLILWNCNENGGNEHFLFA